MSFIIYIYKARLAYSHTHTSSSPSLWVRMSVYVLTVWEWRGMCTSPGSKTRTQLNKMGNGKKKKHKDKDSNCSQVSELTSLHLASHKQHTHTFIGRIFNRYHHRRHSSHIRAKWWVSLKSNAVSQLFVAPWLQVCFVRQWSWALKICAPR